MDHTRTSEEAYRTLGDAFSGLGTGFESAPAGVPPEGAGRGQKPGRTTLIHEDKEGIRCLAKSYERIRGDLEEEINRQGFEGLPARLERYGRNRGRALAMAAFLASGQAVRVGLKSPQKVARDLAMCGSYLVFRWYGGIDLVRLHAAMFCQQDRLCPFCALRRGAKLLQAYAQRTAKVFASAPARLSAWMVTRTVRNGDDLVERLEHLRAADKIQLERRKWAGYRRKCEPTELSAAMAGVGSIEIKRGNGSGQWHPHMHDVWICDREPDQAKLSQEWKEITGDSHVVDVRPFRFQQLGLAPTIENVAPDFLEVFKYALKMSDMGLADNWFADQKLRGRRLVRSFGAYRGIKVKRLTDDLQLEDLPFVEWLYNYDPAVGGYQLSES